MCTSITAVQKNIIWYVRDNIIDWKLCRTLAIEKAQPNSNWRCAILMAIEKCATTSQLKNVQKHHHLIGARQYHWLKIAHNIGHWLLKNSQQQCNWKMCNNIGIWQMCNKITIENVQIIGYWKCAISMAIENLQYQWLLKNAQQNHNWKLCKNNIFWLVHNNIIDWKLCNNIGSWN